MSRWGERLKNLESGGRGTDKADKSHHVSNVSSSGDTFSKIQTPSVSNVSAPYPTFENISMEGRAKYLGQSPSGNDHPPANDSIDEVERLKALPADLVLLAIRYCTETYGDSPDQVKEMLEDLLAVPDDWHWWRLHFMRKLGIPKEARCIDCAHCEDTGGSLGRCLRRVPAPGAGGLWWMTDLHPCIQFSANQEAA